MTAASAPSPAKPPEPSRAGRFTARRRQGTAPVVSLIAQGEPMTWLMGGAVGVCLLMVAGLLALIVYFGSSTFWPLPLVEFTVETADGMTRYLGEVVETAPLADGAAAGKEETSEAVALGSFGWLLWMVTAATTAAVAAFWLWIDPRLLGRMIAGAACLGALGLSIWSGVQLADSLTHTEAVRYKVRTGNFRLTNTHFTWISGPQVVEQAWPEWAVILEPVEYGRFYGYPHRFLVDGQAVAEQPDEVWAAFQQHHSDVRRRWRQAQELTNHGIGALNAVQEQARLATREAEIERDDVARTLEVGQAALRAARHPSGPSEQQPPTVEAAELAAQVNELKEAFAQAEGALKAARQHEAATVEQVSAQTAELLQQVQQLRDENARYQLVMQTAAGQEVTLAVEEIVRGYPANQLSWAGKLGVYLSRWGEFLADDPREANSEGGVLPAIVGTVVMTMIMALAVVPLGVLAALYLREYAKGGLIVSLVRIAINNLAGVPSIVFGVFGLGFFCYIVGGFIDGGPQKLQLEPWPKPTWWLVLAALAVTGTCGFLASIGATHGRSRPSSRYLRMATGVLWIVCTVLLFSLVFKTPYFDGLYRANLPNPTFGKGALVWASLTLALLTLPVVIVSTEEALAAVPNSMREGSYACGASKWQTIHRIVLPRAMPGVMTGMILAMARGAGEVAPLMLVGAVKLVQELPVSFSPPFIHGSQSFMHLGFHIYDVGFQSQNSEAARPLVFTTTLLLIAIIALLNIVSIWLRARLRRKFVSSAF